MTKIKTADLIAHTLDWAVAIALGKTPIAIKKKYSEGWLLYDRPNATVPLEYSAKWSQGGPIIERERIEFSILASKDGWIMAIGVSSDCNDIVVAEGPTYLIAAMRCFVASRIGDEVEIPEELVKISA